MVATGCWCGFYLVVLRGVLLIAFATHACAHIGREHNSFGCALNASVHNAMLSIPPASSYYPHLPPYRSARSSLWVGTVTSPLARTTQLSPSASSARGATHAHTLGAITRATTYFTSWTFLVTATAGAASVRSVMILIARGTGVRGGHCRQMFGSSSGCWMLPLPTSNSSSSKGRVPSSNRRQNCCSSSSMWSLGPSSSSRAIRCWLDKVPTARVFEPVWPV